MRDVEQRMNAATDADGNTNYVKQTVNRRTQQVEDAVWDEATGKFKTK